MENQRIRITKQLLQQSLLQLLQIKLIDKISVTEICAHTQINRSTIYKHYGSQYDVLDEIKTQMVTIIQIG